MIQYLGSSGMMQEDEYVMRHIIYVAITYRSNLSRVSKDCWREDKV